MAGIDPYTGEPIYYEKMFPKRNDFLNLVGIVLTVFSVAFFVWIVTTDVLETDLLKDPEQTQTVED